MSGLGLSMKGQGFSAWGAGFKGYSPQPSIAAERVVVKK